MDAREIIFNYFDFENHNDFLCSLMDYLDTDTLVAWFVDEGHVDGLFDDKEEAIVMKHYDLHCGR